MAEPLPASRSQALPNTGHPGTQPPRGAQILFWVGFALWPITCSLIPMTVPILNALQPSLGLGLALGLLIPIIAVAAANFTALYPAVFRHDLRSRPLIRVAWVLSIIAAVLADLACLWGVARLVIMGPTLS